MTAAILVTGANGLVGRATLARLGPSRRVYAILRASPGNPLPAGALPVVHDLRRGEDPALAEIPETIVHLAQSARYRDFPEGALDVFEVNVGATQRLLDLASRTGVKRFVYASSGGVYGHGEAPFDEEAPLAPDTSLGHYLGSKRCGELVSRAYQGRMTVVVLRFFFVYGPGQRSTMLIPRLIESVRSGRPIVLQGNDGIRVNPIYAEDAAAAVEAAIGLQASTTVNVAGPDVLTLRRLASLIAEAIGHEPRFEVRGGAQPAHLVGDTERMARLLVPPQVGVAEGLRRTLARPESSSRAHHAG